MDQLRAMRVFVKVVECGGMAAAARALDMAPAAVTRLVADLEQHLGARLLNRSTRRQVLTEAGHDYLGRAQRIVAEVDEADAHARDAAHLPRGSVRLLLPPAVSVHQLAKHLPRFYALYPQVTLEITATGPVDVPDDAYDLSILWTRQTIDGDFVARRLARTEALLCATPEYLDRHGRPRHPRELVRHAMLVPLVASVRHGVSFTRRARAGEAPGTPAETVTVVPERTVLRSAHVDTNYAAALAGVGIAGLPSYVVEDALAERALERLLPEWQLFSAELWAAMPSRKHVPARVRALLDFLVQIFGGEDRDPWLDSACARAEARAPGASAAAPA